LINVLENIFLQYKQIHFYTYTKYSKIFQVLIVIRLSYILINTQHFLNIYLKFKKPELKKIIQYIFKDK